MAIKFRTKSDKATQGLKILAYGEDGSGKSLFGLSFPKIAIVDSEAKLATYESSPVFGKNIQAVAETSNYYDVLELTKTIISKPQQFNTFIIDSLTNIIDGMSVACMEVEEARARKKVGANVDDAVVSMRGYGKIKLNTARLKNLNAQLSASGVTLIAIAHKEDVTMKSGDQHIKIGEKPSLRKNSKHDYDVVLRFFKEKDMATGQLRFKCEVEKDTTMSFQVGEVIDTTWETPQQPNHVIYERLSVYMKGMEASETAQTTYASSIEDAIETGIKEDASFTDLTNEFVALYKELVGKDATNKAKIQGLLAEHGIESYKKEETAGELKKVVAILRNM